MEILFWLLPAAVVTFAAMVLVGWWGRENKSAVNDASREDAARKLGEALSRDKGSRPGYAVARRTPDHTSGVAVRPSKSRPVIVPGSGAEAPADTSADKPAHTSAEKSDDQAARDRRAS